MGNFGKIVSSFATNVPRVTKNNHVGSNSSVSSVNKNNATIKNTKLNQKQSEELDFSTQKLGAGVNTTRNSTQNLGAVANATNKIFSSIKVDLNKGSITSLANNVKSYYEKTGATISKEEQIIYNITMAQEKMMSLDYKPKWHEKAWDNITEFGENTWENAKDAWGTTKDVAGYFWEDTKAVIRGDITPLEVAEAGVDNVRISTAYTVGKIGQYSDEEVRSVVSDVKEEVENDDYIEDTVYGIATGIENTKQSAKQAGNEINQAYQDLKNGEITYEEFQSRLYATRDNFVVSTTEGVFKWGEKYADGLKITGGYLINSTAESWGIISEDEMDENLETVQDDVEINATKELYDMFYNDTKYGNYIKNNSYSFDTVRGLGNMTGEMIMNVGTSYAVGNMSSKSVLSKSRVGLSADDAAALQATAKQAAKAGKTAGNITLYTNTSITGMGEGAEIALANGGTIEEALLTGAVTGAWNTAQYAAGAHIAKTTSNVVTRITMDAITGGFEGYVQPAISMIYKDGYYDKNGNYIEYSNEHWYDYFNNYNGTFQEAGGMKNVGVNALYGAVGSAFGEGTDLVSKHPIMKEAIDVDAIKTKPNANRKTKSEIKIETTMNEYEKLMGIKNSDAYQKYINNPSGKAQVLIKDFENVDARLAELEKQLNDTYVKKQASDNTKTNKNVEQNIKSDFDEYERLMSIKNSKEYNDYINTPSGKAQMFIKDFENVDARLAELETKLGAYYDKNNVESKIVKNENNLKNEILATINPDMDSLSKARKLYLELNKRVNYDDSFVYQSAEYQQQKYNKVLTFDNMDDNNIVCKGWAELYNELLVDSGFSPDNVMIRGDNKYGSHKWIEVKLNDGNIIIADATDVINHSNDIANAKAGFSTKGFVYATPDYSGQRLASINYSKEDINKYNNLKAKIEDIQNNKLKVNQKMVDKIFNDYNKLNNKFQNKFLLDLESTSKSTWKNVDNNLNYNSNGLYVEDIIANSNLFENSSLYKNISQKANSSDHFSKVFDMDIPENMTGSDAYAYYNAISRIIDEGDKGDLYVKLTAIKVNDNYESMVSVKQFNEIGDKVMVYSKSLGKNFFTDPIEYKEFMKKLGDINE